MSFIIALLFIITCGFLLIQMVLTRQIIDIQLGVLSLFALGYYPLPVVFKPISTLSDIPDTKVFFALLIHWLFFVMLLVGIATARRYIGAVKPLRFAALDQIGERNRLLFCFIAFLLQLGYVATTPQTSYASQDFDGFFEEKSPIRSIFAAASGLSIGFIAMSYATASLYRDKRGGS